MIDLEVSPGAQADAAAEEQLVDGHLTVPGGLEWDETSPKRHTIANLRYAGGKEHDVRYVSEVHLDAALARGAALREELAEVKRNVKNADMVFNLLSIACQATGETTALVYSKLGDMLNASAERDAIQQRLTVAEQRAGEMANALARIQGRAEMFIDDGMHMPTPSIEAIRDIAAKAALKPAAECPHNYSNPTGCPVCQGIKP